MGQDDAEHASRALRLLNHPDLREHPRTGPAERRTGTAAPGTPLNIGIVDYFAEKVGEVIAHAQTITTQPKRLPRRLEDIYTWLVDSTPDADDVQRRHRDALLLTHRLEHDIRLGNYEVVCKHPCPRCGTWGLMWDHAGQHAQCTNRRCRTPAGLSSTWTLARLAAQKIQGTEIWRRNAT